MKKKYLLAFFAVMTFMLTGCSNYAKDYEHNTLIVKNNKSLIEVAVEDFKGMPVNSEDLTSYIDEQINSYNEYHEKNSIKKMFIDTEDMSKAKLIMAYKDIESYNGFNLLECVLDDYLNVETERLKGDYTSSEGEKVSFDSLSVEDGAKVLIMSEATDVVVKGEILYYNDEVTVNEGVAVCSGKHDAVIIFK